MSYKDYIKDFDYNIEELFEDLPGFVDVTYNGSSYPIFENRALKLLVAFTYDSKKLREDGDEFKFHLYNAYEEDFGDEDIVVLSDNWDEIKEHIKYKSLYQLVFPDFDYSIIGMVPKNFVDCSSKNDTCPSFVNEDTGFVIYYNYMDPNKREVKDTKTFTLLFEDDLIIESDDYSDILNHIYIDMDNEEEIDEILMKNYSDALAIEPGNIEQLKEFLEKIKDEDENKFK